MLSRSRRSVVHCYSHRCCFQVLTKSIRGLLVRELPQGPGLISHHDVLTAVVMVHTIKPRHIILDLSDADMFRHMPSYKYSRVSDWPTLHIFTYSTTSIYITLLYQQNFTRNSMCLGQDQAGCCDHKRCISGSNLHCTHIEILIRKSNKRQTLSILLAVGRTLPPSADSSRTISVCDGPNSQAT